ncbi:hypothetical protein [Methylomagnum sp.]
MWRDPIIEEIHRTREKIAAAYGNDMHAIFLAAQRGELAKALDPSGLHLAEDKFDSATSPSTKPPESAATEHRH